MSIEKELESIDVVEDSKVFFKKKEYEDMTNKTVVFFSKKRDQWSEKIKEYSDIFKDINKLQQIYNTIFTDREILLNERYTLSESIEKNIKILKKEREKKLNKKQDNIKTSQTISIVIESHVSELEERCNVINNHISFLDSTLQTLDHMIFAIKGRITLEELT